MTRPSANGLVVVAAALSLAGCSHEINDQTIPIIPANCTLPTPAVSGLPATQVIELGTHTVGDVLTFNVPEGTGSLTIIHQAVGAVPLQVVFKNGNASSVADNSALPVRINFPDGGEAFNDFNNFPNVSADGTVDSSALYTEFSQDTPVAAAFTIPNTATSLAQGVAPGRWSFVVGDFAYECFLGITCGDGGTTLDKYDLKVLLRPLPTGSNLDINFYIVGAATTKTGVPLSALTAFSDASVKRMIFTLTSLYGAQGITVRHVQFFDVTADQRAAYQHIVVTDVGGEGPCDQLDQMFTISGANPGMAMNLFLVADLTDTSPSGSGTLVGIDGTIPGVSSLAGTVHSGAAVSLSDLFAGTCSATGTINLAGCGADNVAYIAAHETGHFLGLFHTSEMNGDLVDPLTDTVKCACNQCTSPTANCGRTDGSAPILDAVNCNGATCGGATNLMFWSIDRDLSQGVLTAQQAQIIKLNPTIQ